MLTYNLAHLLATDAHNAASRLLTVDKSAAYLEEEQGSGTAGLMLSTRPRRLLADQPLDLPEPKPMPEARPRKFNPFSRFRRS